MRCDSCNGVIFDVKLKTEKDIGKRIYKCKKCGYVFETIEKKKQKNLERNNKNESSLC